MKNAHKKSKQIAGKRSTHKRVNRRKYIESILEEINKTGVKTDSFSYKETSYKNSALSKTDKKREEKIARGTFSSSKSGFGFVTLDNGYERDIFIPEDKTLGAIDGDLVEISYHLYRDRFSEEKSEGRVLKIVEFGLKTLIGTVVYKREGLRKSTLYPYLSADDRKLTAEPKINANHIEASLSHEATIGKIAGEQLIKLMTLGLSEKEAEEQIVNGFLK